MLRRQDDMRSLPVTRIVALGESTTWGYSVSDKDKCWVSQVAGMLEEFQGAPIELINQGIGSNVITAECPAYEFSAKPSALERVDAELIAHDPDMVFLSYGLNDSRGGTSLEVFRRAYQELIDRIRAEIDCFPCLSRFHEGPQVRPHQLRCQSACIIHFYKSLYNLRLKI